MYYFDLTAFIRYNFRAFFKTKGTQYRLTPKRFFILLLTLIIYIPGELFTRICLLLDDIFFPGYRNQEIKNPIFIIGNPRSGTTYLHRLMYKDTEDFTAFTVWEMIFAPSVIQRKAIWGIGKVARWLGAPVSRWVKLINKPLNSGKGGSAHTLRLNEAEEDGHILIHSWTSESLWAIYPIPEEAVPYFLFDQEIPLKKRRRIMKFYKNLVQRHVYAHGGHQIFLSKNPSFTGKIASVTEAFPDARFINLVRTPFKAMPSMLDYMSTGWKLFCDPTEAYPYKDEFYKVMKYYYMYPVEFFQDKGDMVNFVMYDDLVHHTDEIMDDLYTWLHIEIPPRFQRIVAEEAYAMKQYHSPHEYSLEEMGLTEEKIYSEFEEVFSYYEFDNHSLELPDHIMFWEMKAWPKIWKTQRAKRKKSHQAFATDVGSTSVSA